MRSLVPRALALVLLLALPACKHDDPVAPQVQSSFTATVSGATSASLKGVANFATAATGFTLTLANAASDGSAITFVRPAGTPAAGTFALGAAHPQTSDFLAMYTAGGSAMYVASGGTLTITAISGDRMTGSFSFPATGGSSGTATVNVGGSFEATRVGTP